MRIKNVDMLNGSLLKGILYFGIPLLFVSLIQNLFNAVDIMVLGAMADTNAVASVGATSAITHLLVNLAIGISNGTKIVLSRLLGEREDDKASKTVYTSIITSLILGVGVAVLGTSLSGVFLNITNCPAEIYDGAHTYLCIYFASVPAVLLYNFGSNILQVTGDSQRPLYYMIVSGLLNIVLNIILCLVLPNKAAAVAIATAASQILGAFLVIRRILRMDGPCRLNIKSRGWNTGIFKKLLINGLPIGFTSALYPLSNLQIQSSINSFGPAAIAGNSAMSNLDNIESAICSAPWCAASGVFVGKNLGANSPKRVKRSMAYCIGISGILSISISLLLFAFSGPLLSLFLSNDAEAIAYGQIRVLFVTLPYVICAINTIFVTSIQAFGYAVFTTINSITSVLLFRVFWMNVIFPLSPSFHMLMLCFSVSWCMVAVLNLVFFSYIYFRKFKKGLIKKMG